MKNGTRVKTEFGVGTVVGIESFFGGNLVRILVELDPGHTWSFKNQISAFFEKDLEIVNDRFKG